eukprot:1162268-Amphidinium_carterae.1
MTACLSFRTPISWGFQRLRNTVSCPCFHLPRVKNCFVHPCVAYPLNPRIGPSAAETDYTTDGGFTSTSRGGNDALRPVRFTVSASSTCGVQLITCST